MTQLDQKLYELFSDKTLSEGCIIHWNEFKNWELSENSEYVKFYKETDSWFSQSSYCIATNWKEYCIYTILWHPPQLHDVFRVAKSKYCIINVDESSMYIAKYPEKGNQYIPYNTSIHILKQSDETKSTLISLFS
jgi:hypothetical protein